MPNDVPNYVAKDVQKDVILYPNLVCTLARPFGCTFIRPSVRTFIRPLFRVGK